MASDVVERADLFFLCKLEYCSPFVIRIQCHDTSRHQQTLDYNPEHLAWHPKVLTLMKLQPRVHECFGSQEGNDCSSIELLDRLADNASR